jgi:predicted  nucleic acid-binding Zn-ribbon protein
MKFLTLEIEYEQRKKNFEFYDKTLIFSNENSVGKSTLLRLLFYGIGYPIPGTYGIKFKKVKLKVSFTRDNNIYFTRRKDNYIEIYKNDVLLDSRYLNGHDNTWLTYIWGIESINVLKNILGAIYMDQDKGWTLLNRGKVIGNIRFNVRDLLIGLSDNGESLKENLEKLGTEKEMLKETRQLIQLASTSSMYGDLSLSALKEPDDERLDMEYKNLQIQKKYLKQQLSKMRKQIADENGLMKFILSSNIMIQVNGENILVDKNNLKNFNNNVDFLKQRAAIFCEKIENLDYRLEHVKRELREKASNLFDDEVDVVKRTLNDISKINIDTTVLQARETELSDSVKKLNDKIEEEFMTDNDMTEETLMWINKFADILGVLDVIKNKKFVFTRDLKSISGTIYYKVVFSFKMAYIKMIEKYTGVILPIVLDSPSGREVTERNISAVIDILNDFFAENQIIITSINKYKLNGVREIELKESLFGE